jgi:NAD+ kinase
VSRPPRSLTVFTHKRPEHTSDALRRVIELAPQAGVEVRIPQEEVDKHGLVPVEGVTLGADPAGDTDLAVVLGGDGTILSTLRLYAGRRVTVFAVNFGTIGFLATVEPSELDEGMRMALAGELDVLELPGLVAGTSNGDELAMNDISFHRRHTGRVAELAYSVEGEQLGEVRCDGLVVATPAGSTGYNLANGGPVLAWGVEGYVVSFIAPHTLTARALVVAPDGVLAVTNRSREEDVEMTTDGRTVCVLPREDTIEIRFERGCALLAQLPGASFYHRLREKFGRLAY